MPRPLKLDDQKKQRLIHLVMHGATVAGAAREVGCSVRTVEREADRDESFGWRLDIARDSRDADPPQDEATEEADAVTVDLLFEGFCVSLTDELALLWPSKPHGSGRDRSNRIVACPDCSADLSPVDFSSPAGFARDATKP